MKELDELLKALDNLIVRYKEKLPISQNLEVFRTRFAVFRHSLPFSLAKEHGLRNLVAEMEKNEHQYERTKQDCDTTGQVWANLDGRICESRVIRIQLEKVFAEDFAAEPEGSTDKSFNSGVMKNEML